MKALRALRALRPLRTVSRSPSLKVVVNALLKSIPAVADVMLILIIVFLIFAIIGVNYFKGTGVAVSSVK